ncbi:MAG: MFS transporter, partial [Dehalococcoidales bacterium]
MNFRNLTFRGKPVYYGWVIVGGLSLVIMVSMGLLGINFGLFIEPMSRELGVGQAFFGWAQSGRLIGSAASGFILGHILDRYGARVPMAIAGLLVCGLMLMMGNITDGWQIVGIFVLLGLLGLQGAGGSLYAIVSISNWFMRKRSKAMSRVFLGTPIGIFIVAPLTAYLIQEIGWRDTVMILGLAGGVVVFLVALVIRRRPEDMGQLMDGDSPDENQTLGGDSKEGQGRKPDPVPAREEYSWTRAEAVRSPTFWKLSVAFGLSMFARSTANLFRVPHFVSRGISAQMVAYSLSFEAVVVFAIAFPVGWAAARFQLRYLLILSHVVSMSVILLMFIASEVWHVFLINALFGISATSQMIAMGVIWPDYFGKDNVGSIRGLTMPITTALSFSGPPLAG